MTAHVAADHVNCLSVWPGRYRLGEERAEAGADIAWGRLAQHFAGGHIQRGKQARGAVAFVFEVVPLGASGRTRQHSVYAIKRLNGRFPIHAEHHRMQPRVQVQADRIDSLGRKVGIVEHHVGIEMMRPIAVVALDMPHRREGRAQLRGQLSVAAVCRAVGQFASQRVVPHSRFKTRQVTMRSTTRVPIVQARQAVTRKASVRCRDETRIASQFVHDRPARGPFVEQQDRSRSPRLANGHRSAARTDSGSSRSDSFRFILPVYP